MATIFKVHKKKKLPQEKVMNKNFVYSQLLQRKNNDVYNFDHNRISLYISCDSYFFIFFFHLFVVFNQSHSKRMYRWQNACKMECKKQEKANIQFLDSLFSIVSVLFAIPKYWITIVRISGSNSKAALNFVHYFCSNSIGCSLFEWNREKNRITKVYDYLRVLLKLIPYLNCITDFVEKQKRKK